MHRNLLINQTKATKTSNNLAKILANNQQLGANILIKSIVKRIENNACWTFKTVYQKPVKHFKLYDL